jgi:hypothetical protein
MTIEELRTRIKQRLGEPVINVELATEQMDIYIEDTVDKFIEVHYDGLDTGYIFLETIKDQQEYILDDKVHSVLNVYGSNSSKLNDEALLINPYTVGDVNTFSTDILDLTLFRQSISMYEDFMSDEKMFEYNSSTNKLFILETPEKIEKLALKIHRSPESIEKVYENSWVQKYIAALCKIAWGQNIGKFAGGTLPGGVALDYNRIIQEGKEEKQELEEELYSRYSEPYDFFTA